MNVIGMCFNQGYAMPMHVSLYKLLRSQRSQTLKWRFWKAGGKSSLSLLSRNTFLMNICHYFLPIFRLHRNMQVCLACMYGRDTCFLAWKVGGIRLRVWDSWDSLERWWQKYSYATYNLKKLIFFRKVHSLDSI